jgi:bifunctional DNA-binding transcriptional regulator/antitoxin component of YhaV-PrlF toxin-antitoxin module
MAYVLSLENGRLQFPTELLEELGVGPDDRVSIRSQNGTLVIKPTDNEIESVGPTFRTEEPAPLKLDDMLKEVGPEYIAEAYSDAGLLTRDEFMAILHEYEEQFGLSSAEFYEKWQQGEMPDQVEFTFWAHMYEESLDGHVLFKGEAPLEDIVGQPSK